MVITLDSESSDPSSSLGGTYLTFLFFSIKNLFFDAFLNNQINFNTEFRKVTYNNKLY